MVFGTPCVNRRWAISSGNFRRAIYLHHPTAFPCASVRSDWLTRGRREGGEGKQGRAGGGMTDGCYPHV